MALPPLMYCGSVFCEGSLVRMQERTRQNTEKQNTKLSSHRLLPNLKNPLQVRATKLAGNSHIP